MPSKRPRGRGEVKLELPAPATSSPILPLPSPPSSSSDESHDDITARLEALADFSVLARREDLTVGDLRWMADAIASELRRRHGEFRLNVPGDSPSR